jgi:hypothetical protein
MAATGLFCTAELGIGVVLAALILAFVALFGAILLLIKAFFSVVGRLARSIWHALGGGHHDAADWLDDEARYADAGYSARGGAVRICGNERCRRRNPLEARYCGRCGWKLGSGS